MQLADNELNALLDELQIRTNKSDYPFDPERQVQPASIDLRLDDVFWKLARPRGVIIDLSPSRLDRARPRRHWRRIDLGVGEQNTLRRGETIFGRTLERFRIPNGYVGILIGRSSIARMGIMVHCSAGYMNPGWEGHMPLQIVNMSGATIKLPPYIRLCQLLIAKASSSSLRPYGSEELASKYRDDDGGPTFWWKGDRVELERELSGVTALRGPTSDGLLDILGAQDFEVTERLIAFVKALPAGELDNADAIMDKFAAAEETRRVWRDGWLNATRGLLGLMAAGALSLFTGWWKALCVIPSAVIAWHLTLPATVYFGKQKLNARRDAIAGSRESPRQLGPGGSPPS